MLVKMDVPLFKTSFWLFATVTGEPTVSDPPPKRAMLVPEKVNPPDNSHY